LQASSSSNPQASCQAWCIPLHKYHLTTCSLQIPMSVCRETSSCQTGLLRDREDGTVPEVVPTAHDKNTQRLLEPCGGYLRLNLQFEPDHYPLPNMADLRSQWTGLRFLPSWTYVVRYILFQLLHLRSEEQRPQLPMDDEPDIRQPSILNHLSG